MDAVSLTEPAERNDGRAQSPWTTTAPRGESLIAGYRPSLANQGTAHLNQR